MRVANHASATACLTSADSTSAVLSRCPCQGKGSCHERDPSFCSICPSKAVPVWSNRDSLSTASSRDIVAPPSWFPSSRYSSVFATLQPRNECHLRWSGSLRKLWLGVEARVGLMRREDGPWPHQIRSACQQSCR